MHTDIHVINILVHSHNYSTYLISTCSFCGEVAFIIFNLKQTDGILACKLSYIYMAGTTGDTSQYHNNDHSWSVIIIKHQK